MTVNWNEGALEAIAEQAAEKAEADFNAALNRAVQGAKTRADVEVAILKASETVFGEPMKADDARELAVTVAKQIGIE